MTYSPAVLRFLVVIADAYERAIEDAADTDLKYHFPLGLTITSVDGHVATLYEEGWDFTPPKAKEADK